jgi:hypothetical protein
VKADGEELPAAGELLAGGLVAARAQRAGEVVERGVRAGQRRAELGREGERKLGVAGAGAAGVMGERAGVHREVKSVREP